MELKTVELKDILQKHLPTQQKIDFMDIDVEGSDLDVLMSNDWTKFRPTMLLIEDTSVDTLSDALNCAISSFITKHGYILKYRTPRTLFFVSTL